jgi:hypothetical protein
MALSKGCSDTIMNKLLGLSFNDSLQKSIDISRVSRKIQVSGDYVHWMSMDVYRNIKYT